MRPPKPTTSRVPTVPNIGSERVPSSRALVGFAGGFFTIWASAAAFDVAFILGFTLHGSEGVSNAILGAAGLLAVGALLIAVFKRMLLAWTVGLIVGLAALYFGLWSLTGAAVQGVLQ